MKKIIPLYDHASDTLKGLTESEYKMIGVLSSSPPSRIMDVLAEFLENSNDKSLFFSRTEEIFLCYQRWGALVMNPFSFKQNLVTLVIEYLELLRTRPSGSSVKPSKDMPPTTSIKRSINKVARELKLETIITPFSTWNKVRNLLVNEEVLTKTYSLNFRGNDWKKRTIFLIHELENKKYFDRLSSDQVAVVIKGTFNVTITRRYVDMVFSSGEQTDEFKFIPVNSHSS